jgi:excisionase family DNA binding protein
MFCTLKEAAETLNASEDQINTLLERGILHEFRQGPHRLLREADVDALDLRRGHRPEAQPPAQPPVRTKRPSPRSGDKPKASRSVQRKVHPCATAVARPARPQRTKNARPGTQDTGRRAEDRRQKPEDARQKMENRPANPPVVRPPSSGLPTMTLRQWFWMGLVQDRPAAIALLSGLVLLALSALVAGMCLAAEGL